MRPARTSEAAFAPPPARGPSRPRPIDPAFAVVGAVIHAARTRRGVSQGEVARFVGVTVRAVQAWEMGREKLPPDRVEALARCLDLAPDALDGAEHIARTPGERAALARYRAEVEGKVMTFEPVTEGTFAEVREAYDRAGIARPPAPPSTDLPVSSEILPAPVRLVASAFAAACLFGFVAAQPGTIAALVPAGLVLGIEIARAVWDLVQARAVAAQADRIGGE